MGHRTLIGLLVAGACATMLLPSTATAQQDRVSATEKGSLLYFSKIEIRWSSTGGLLQDTFISLTNDYPADVKVQGYYVNGDPPLAAAPPERAHPGWIYQDFSFTLTGDQPAYWSVLTGLPAVGGLPPFTALDPGFPPGRPDPESATGERMLRGFAVIFAVNPGGNKQIRWNHLKGEGTIVNYGLGYAWEYNSWNHQVVDLGIPNGDPAGVPGMILLNGVIFSQTFDLLLFNFQAPGSNAFSGPRQVVSDTDLTIHPCYADFRQEGDGPVTTKANFDIWNMNEVKFSETHRCITCWDQALLSDYAPPNSFVLGVLQTAHGKARVNGLASQVCDVDCDPTDGLPLGADPCDIVSTDEALLAVVARILTIDGGMDHAAAGTNVIGQGTQDCAVLWDILPPPPEGADPAVEILEDVLDEDAPRASRGPALGRD